MVEEKKQTHKEEDNIVVPRDQWESLLQTVTELKENQGADDKKAVSILDNKIERTVKLRTVDGIPVIGLKEDKFGRVIMEKMRNEMGEEDFRVTAILLGGKEKKLFYLMDLLREAPSIECKIVERKLNKKVKEHGVVERKSVPEGGWSAIGTGAFVKLEEVSYDTVFNLELPDGELVEVNEKFVNI